MPQVPKPVERLAQVEMRAQPWKAFCDPNNPAFRDIIAAAPPQVFLGVGDAALTQYASENK